MSRKGEVVSSSRGIALNYLRGWFVVDLLAALPFDHLYASDLYKGEVTNRDTTSTHCHQFTLTRICNCRTLDDTPGIAHPSRQADAAAATGPAAAENGSILAVHGHDTDAADAVLLAGGPLAGVRLVRDCREGAGDERCGMGHRYARVY